MKRFLLLLCIISTVLLSGCDNKTDYMKEGENAFENGNYETAIKFYKKELRKNHQNSQAYAMYCLSQFNLYKNIKNGTKINITEALQKCDKAIEIDPNNYKAHRYKGYIYDDLQKIDNSINEYSLAININPKDAKSYYYRGLSYFKKKEYNKGLNDITQVINLKEEDLLLYAYKIRGEIYRDLLKDDEKAKKDFQQVSKIEIKDKYEDNEKANEYFVRGSAKEDLNDDNGAIFDFKKSIEYSNDENLLESAYEHLVKAMGRNKDYYGAIAIANEGLEKFGDSESLYFSRGLVNILKINTECSSKTENCHIDKDDYTDILKARELALKHNNETTYKDSIRAEELLNELAKEINIKPQKIITITGER